MESEAIKNSKLLIDEKLITKGTPKFIKDFNEEYRKVIELDSDESNKEWIQAAINCAITIARDFDFDNELVSEYKDSYIELARHILKEASSKKYYNENAMIYYIRALYGQTKIAYPHDPLALEAGNEYVTTLERFTQNHTLKAYALALRSYIYIMYGEELEMTVEDRLHVAERDLIYATKWDENNYLAYLALGLIYFDKGNDKFDVNKALTNFVKAASYENEHVALDDYLTEGDKINLMNAAKSLKAQAK